MGFFKRLIDVLTQGSQRPMRRLVAYYVFLAALGTGLAYAFPIVDQMFSGERLEQLASTPQLLQDGLGAGAPAETAVLAPRFELAISTALICFGTLALMLPVSWVYMSAKRTPRHEPVGGANAHHPAAHRRGDHPHRPQQPRAGVQPRRRRVGPPLPDHAHATCATSCSSSSGSRSGSRPGVQLLTVAVVLSVVFNFVLLLTWHYDFGRNVLEPTAASQWAEPLDKLAQREERRHGAGPRPGAGAHAEEGRASWPSASSGCASIARERRQEAPLQRDPHHHHQRARQTPRNWWSWRSTRSSGAGSWTRS